MSMQIFSIPPSMVPDLHEKTSPLAKYLKSGLTKLKALYGTEIHSFSVLLQRSFFLFEDVRALTPALSIVEMVGHRNDIKAKRVEKPVAEHFNQPGHSMDDLTIMCKNDSHL